jgi:hypothetical protein
MHDALGCFYQIINENQLELDGIEEVNVLLTLVAELPLWRETGP